jgi:uncharacterized protein
MKKFIVILMLGIAVQAFSQQPSPNPFPKTISVAGSAEMEVIPDQIFVHVTLNEYQKKGEDKKELETIKADFLNACKAANIADSNISIVSYTGYNNYYWLKRKKKSMELNASIVYQVKFSTSNQMDNLIEKLDDEATQSFDIVNTSHSKMTEFRKQLKIGAVKAAKDKAIYLTDAIGEKLGGAITVKEPDETPDYSLQGSNMMANSQARFEYDKSDNNKSVEVAFKKIKLRFTVDVVFALQ